jgi:hypothetical protein
MSLGAAVANSWVVFRAPDPTGGAALGVCEEAEWAEMECLRPGHYTLVQAGFGHESDAERFARYG